MAHASYHNIEISFILQCLPKQPQSSDRSTSGYHSASAHAPIVGVSAVPTRTGDEAVYLPSSTDRTQHPQLATRTVLLSTGRTSLQGILE